MSMSMATDQEIAEFDRMRTMEPLYTIVRRVSPIRVVLRARVFVNGRQREGEWVLSKSFVRTEHECVCCRRNFSGRHQVRMYKPPLDYPQGMRCCEGCGEEFDRF